MVNRNRMWAVVTGVLGTVALGTVTLGIVAPGGGVRAAGTPQATGAAQPPAGPASAAGLVSEALEAMGGQATLLGIKTISLDAIGHHWALEQSERPEGPWLTIYEQRHEVRDLVQRRGTVETQTRFWGASGWTPKNTLVVADGVSARTNGQRWAPGRAVDVTNFESAVDLAPERLLITAGRAADLKRLPDETLQGVVQRVVGFSYQNRRARVFLNGWTHLPTMLEIVADGSFGIWGDVTERRWFSFWTLETGGIRYPRQVSTEWNGLPYADLTTHDLVINPDVDPQSFVIPEETQQAFAANASRPSGMAGLTLDESRVAPVADWVTQVPGGFNVEFIQQPDGVIVIEATTGSGYSAQVLALAEKRFPGVPVKAVVTTSDAWPHLGGIREYVARGIPIYALDLNVPIVSRLIEAPKTIAPDALEKARRAPTLTAVRDRMTIGSGETRVDLIPVRGEYGERMMLVWMPGANLLYTSDLIQPGQPGTGGFFMPQMLTEVVAAAQREGLTNIETVFGMHLAPTPWKDVLAAIATAKKEGT